MNYLTLKVNRDIGNIVQYYLSPYSHIIKNKHINCMISLIDKTFFINDRLERNICLDDNQEYHYNLINSRIVKLDHNEWSIIKRRVN